MPVESFPSGTRTRNRPGRLISWVSRAPLDPDGILHHLHEHGLAHLEDLFDAWLSQPTRTPRRCSARPRRRGRRSWVCRCRRRRPPCPGQHVLHLARGRCCREMDWRRRTDGDVVLDQVASFEDRDLYALALDVDQHLQPAAFVLVVVNWGRTLFLLRCPGSVPPLRPPRVHRSPRRGPRSCRLRRLRPVGAVCASA